MKYSLVIVALLGLTAAIKNPEVPVSKEMIQTEADLDAGCEPAIDVSQKQLDIELDYFSRNFDRKHYKKAMQVYKELKG